MQPGEPDAYTLQFYAELAEGVAGRLQTHYAAMPESTQYIAEAIRQAWLTCGADLATVPNEGLRLTGSSIEELSKQLYNCFRPVCCSGKLKPTPIRMPRA